MKTAFLVIDPQNDFVDAETGTLYVPGAEEDMRRLAGAIDRLRAEIDAIHVTLDSHHPIHIAHPVFWRDRDGASPPPFTTITLDDVESGRWTAARPELAARARAYVRALEENGRYQLTIWPPHCLVGSPGHAVYPPLFAAFEAWERERFVAVDYVMKGSNLYTEHYSAVRADVVDPDDPSTALNTRLIAALERADRVVVAGEALTHCVASTVRDIAANFDDPAAVSKLVLLTDATSPIPGFEPHADSFLDDLRALGMQTATCDEIAG
jgi:nicotinamidase-related amidase